MSQLGRPAAYVSRASLARELDVAESTVDTMVGRGVLPAPVRLSNGCVRWRWADVDKALAALGGRDALPAEDPYLTGARHATST